MTEVKQDSVIRIEYDENANYRLCNGRKCSEWTPYRCVAVLGDMVAFSEYFGEALENKVFILMRGNFAIVSDIKR